MIRRTRAEITHAWIAASYWIRPYDVIADRRRWRWQRRAPCGSNVWADTPPAVRESLVALLEAAERARRSSQ